MTGPYFVVLGPNATGPCAISGIILVLNGTPCLPTNQPTRKKLPSKMTETFSSNPSGGSLGAHGIEGMARSASLKFNPKKL